MDSLPEIEEPPAHRAARLLSLLAQAVNQWPDWPDKVAPASVFASTAKELTPDLAAFWRRPVDWAVLFPGATQWLRQHHVTDLRRTHQLPRPRLARGVDKDALPSRTMADWNALGQAMTQISQQASTQIHAKYVSTISANFAP